VSQEYRRKAREIYFSKSSIFFLTFRYVLYNIEKQSDKAKPSVRVGRKAKGLTTEHQIAHQSGSRAADVESLQKGGRKMMVKMGALVIMALLLCGIPTHGSAAQVLVSQADSWGYTVLTTDLWSNWGSVGYSSFDWNSATWTPGQAAFGNGGGLPQHTSWGADTDLALQKTITINNAVTGYVWLNVASDNGFAIFVNGTMIAKDNAEGYTSIWEYSLNVNPSVFTIGDNLIQAFAEDHGGATYFDMKLTSGNAQPVPVPGALWLLSPGLVGLAAVRRRFTK
jgi:hypothetical protein